MGGVLRLVFRLAMSLRIPLVTLPIRLVALLLGARGHRCRMKPVVDDATGDGPKDQSARDQSRADHAKTAEDALHHVITNNQRRRCALRSLLRPQLVK
jgi:hypothetical protein